MFSCSKRPQSAGGGEEICVDDFVEGEGEDFVELGDGGIDDEEILDGETYSDCDGGSHSFDCSEEEEEVEAEKM